MKTYSREKAQKVLDEKRLYFEIGYRVRIARDMMNLTQQELATKLGCTRVYVTMIERGSFRLPLTTLYHLAYHLKLQPKQLLPTLADLLSSR